jgi:hypothetical protein
VCGPAAEIAAAAHKRDAIKRLELDEILERLEQDYTAQADTLPDPENNTWLRWSQWPAHNFSTITPNRSAFGLKCSY